MFPKRTRAAVPSAVGFRAKTGRAILVALGGPSSTPVALVRREIDLTSKAVPDTREPYHAVMELPWDEAILAVAETTVLIEDVATSRLGTLIEELWKKGCSLDAVGVTGSPDRDLTRIGSRHIRTHAAEGILFRRVLETAAAAHRLPCVTLSDRGLAASIASFDVELTSLGRALGSPWRADERAAATMALLALRRIEAIS